VSVPGKRGSKKPGARPRLERVRQSMPAFVRRALTARGLMTEYRRRPAYQQNDYLGWIAGAKLDTTKQKRLAQMLDELEAGNVYMKMRWSPSRAARA
jgi:hypothetical protein